MEKIKILLEYFLLALSFGTGFFTFLVQPKVTGLGFIKLIYAVCAGSAALALMTRFFLVSFSFNQEQIVIFSYLALILIQCLPFVLKEELKSLGKILSLIYVLKNFFFLYLSYYLVNGDLNDWGFYLSTIGFIGCVVYGMILGHWYLVVPKLSERPLLDMIKLTWLCLGIKILYSCWSFWVSSDILFEEDALGLSYSFKWLILTMRVLWGHLILFILSIFAWKLIKIRSIQSATGVLYVMVFFLFVGELISAYLFFNYGLKI